jgi:hypothetical protein
MVLLFVEICAFYFMSLAIHEEFHMLMGNALGIDGYVVFNIDEAHYYYWQQPNNMAFITLVRLAGGLGSGLVFFILYQIFNLKNRDTGFYQMEMFAFLTISIWQIVYGLTELSNLGITIGNLIGLGCGLGFTFIYFTFLKKIDIFP